MNVWVDVDVDVNRYRDGYIRYVEMEREGQNLKRVFGCDGNLVE